MDTAKIILKKLWARQQISRSDVNYDMWREKRSCLQQMAEISRSCIFTVDVYRGVYDYASGGFEELLGVDRKRLNDITRQGDWLEDLIHPDDREILSGLQIKHSHFIYSLRPQQRNDYRTVYQYRMQNARKQYINVISRQQVIEKTSGNKAWIVMGMMELSPDQTPAAGMKCAVVNLKTGRYFNPLATIADPVLTRREIEVLELIRNGYLGKEIAAKLHISLNTVNNHRKKILAKLQANNAIEAINHARTSGIIG